MHEGVGACGREAEHKRKPNWQRTAALLPRFGSRLHIFPRTAHAEHPAHTCCGVPTALETGRAGHCDVPQCGPPGPGSRCSRTLGSAWQAKGSQGNQGKAVRGARLVSVGVVDQFCCIHILLMHTELNSTPRVRGSGEQDSCWQALAPHYLQFKALHSPSFWLLRIAWLGSPKRAVDCCTLLLYWR